MTCLHFNEKLQTIVCDNNYLTCLHLNENLKELYCRDNQLTSLYYCLKFKKRLRDILWVKIREPKIRIKYSHDYLVEHLHEETDLDELLRIWMSC